MFSDVCITIYCLSLEIMYALQCSTGKILKLIKLELAAPLFNAHKISLCLKR